MKIWFLIITFILRTYLDINAQHIHLAELKSPVLFHGDERTAYRDPAVLYHDKVFHLFFTLTEIETDGRIYSYTAYSRSTDLIQWSVPQKLTARDQNLGFSSPGNIIKYQREWILCLQTYPRPDYTVKQMPRYGDQSARLYIMQSKDLENWSEPELLKVKGPDVPVQEMGRMIDPYLLRDKDNPEKIWCFYKQNGVSMSWSYDLKNWTYSGHTESGENVCVLIENNQYVLFHSPKNGIGIKRSSDMKTWTDWGDLITLGQKDWDWARGRITAGAVIKLQKNQKPKYLMFFHGSGPLPESQYFDKNASIGIAWSDDLKNWEWPGKSGAFIKTD